MQWTQAQRTEKMNPSVIREILKITEKPGVISFAGGLPSPKTFPVAAFAKACQTVLAADGQAALQYAASEGYAPLREWVANDLMRQSLAAGLPWHIEPNQILITTGSQQALDLVGKILIDKDAKVLMETPTYLGALQAFTPMEPVFVSVASDKEGIDVTDLNAKAAGARFLYVLPNFQNPTGQSMSEARRTLLSQEASSIGLPIVEDNPYGDLWFDAPPPPTLAARNPEGCIYMGSFSKTLAPGLRLGFLVAPASRNSDSIFSKLLQAKQAADLHTPSFNQRMVYEVLKTGFLDAHVPMIRALYKAQRDAMLEALNTHLAGTGVQWNTPNGGMFLWVQLPQSMNAVNLLPHAIDRNVAYVPGAAFYSGQAQVNTLRLSFVTASIEQIHQGIAALAQVFKAHLPD